MKKIIFLVLFLNSSLLLYSQESVFFQTDDGWKIHSKYVRAKKNHLPVLLLIHSQKSNYTEWKKWFSEIENYGYGWLSIELRGHGVSTYKVDGSSYNYQSFSVSGFDNEYNKMIRDIDAAVIYLSSTGVKEANIFLVGINLGANIAIKYGAINKNIGGIVAINPAVNINDVLVVNPLMKYASKPILFICGQNYKKRMQEVLLLYDITKKRNGMKNTFIMTEYSITTADVVSRFLIYKILSWIKNPVLPDIIENKNNEVLNSTSTSLSTSTSPLFITIDEDEK